MATKAPAACFNCDNTTYDTLFRLAWSSIPPGCFAPIFSHFAYIYCPYCAPERYWSTQRYIA